MTTTTDTAPDAAASPDAALSLTDVSTLTELIAEALTSKHMIGGHFIRLFAMLDDSGAIALTITGTDFLADTDPTVRVLLTISDPISVVPAAGEPGVEIGATA